MEAKQSESLSELITLREALESSRLEGELLRQEQVEVTAALARVCGPSPLESRVPSRGAGWLIPHPSDFKSSSISLQSLVCFWVLSLPTCPLHDIQ